MVTEEELKFIPRIGQVRARKIIEIRLKFGKIINEKTLSQLGIGHEAT